MFTDRFEAGRLIAPFLEKYRGTDGVVLGLARGGVVVAYEIAKSLSLPLSVVVPRKIGAPGNPELALGAIMENGEGVFNDWIIGITGATKKYIESEIETEKAKARMRLANYQGSYSLPEITGRIAILVDDGIATGATMQAAIKGMRQAKAKKVVVGVPVASVEALAIVKKLADEVVCLHSQADFFGISQFYKHFEQTEDAEVKNLLEQIAIEKAS